MPKPDDVIAGEPIEAAWGNQSIRDHTVLQMASEADRDQSFPAGQFGDVCYVADIQELQVISTSDYGIEGWLAIALVDDVERAIIQALDAYLPLSGGTMTGDIDLTTHLLTNQGTAPPVTLVDSGGTEKLNCTQAGATVTVTFRTKASLPHVFPVQLPAGIRPVSGDLPFAATISDTGGTEKAGETALCRVRSGGDVYVGNASPGYTSGSDSIGGTLTYVVGSRGV